MNHRDPKLTALLFNECINNQDINGLSALMTDDHTFIDREDKSVAGKEAMIEGWIEFFEMFPRYRNTFVRVESRDNLVILLGCAFWNEEDPHDAAIWVAKIEDDLVAEWRIYNDSEENRVKFNIACRGRN